MFLHLNIHEKTYNKNINKRADFEIIFDHLNKMQNF